MQYGDEVECPFPGAARSNGKPPKAPKGPKAPKVPAAKALEMIAKFDEDKQP